MKKSEILTCWISAAYIPPKRFLEDSACFIRIALRPHCRKSWMGLGMGKQKTKSIGREYMSARHLKTEDLQRFAVHGDFKPCRVAEFYGFTLRQLERRFGADLGTTPKDWIRKYRCGLAMKLIAQGFKNKVIVSELKFGNDAQLCHDFRRVYGSSPQSFSPLPRLGRRTGENPPAQPA